MELESNSRIRTMTGKNTFQLDIGCKMWIPLQMNSQEDSCHKMLNLE
jgi:hypothetical protein